MKRLRACLLLLLLPIVALADGKVFRPIAVAADVTIPDQRALIHFTNGIERLVIETRFTGSGTNFAWVIPLPAQPKIEEATVGMFSTLFYQLRPKVIHGSILFAVFLFCIAVGYLLLYVRAGSQFRLLDLAACALAGASLLMIGPIFSVLAFLLLLWIVERVRQGKEKPYAILVTLFIAFFLSGMLLPALSGAGTSIRSSDVTELSSQRVGVFDTQIIAARDSSALMGWLRENQFDMPADVGPVVADYIKRGWVFATARLRRDDASVSTNSIHPLSFTFSTERAVYPLRLTGVGNGPLGIELYVFGPRRAEIEHFKIERCGVVSFPEQTPGFRTSTTEIPIMHPLLREWVSGSAVVTKLTAALGPKQMQQDAEIGWVDFTPYQQVVYSHRGAAMTAADWATGLMLALFLISTIVTAIKKEWQSAMWKVSIGIVGIGLLMFATAFIVFPKVAVHVTKYRPFFARVFVERLGAAAVRNWTNSPPVSLVEARAAVFQGGADTQDNVLFGGPIREEDSPGNYVIRQTTNGFEFVWFDGDGGEHIITTQP